MPFIHDDFLLHSKSARRLYHDYAEEEPILDYHTHLPPKDVAENRQFANLFEIALEGDHYKWRAMRANGVDEKYCTGDADPYEKFLAFARTVPYTLRNPLYHWTHLELKRYFGISKLLNEDSAKKIWDNVNDQLATTEFRAQGILKKFHVKAVCTTDDPTDDLRYHQQIREAGVPTRIFPTFRPDKALNVHKPELFQPWLHKLAEVSNAEISSFQGFVDALKKRHDFFHELGGRLSDHGMNHAFADFCTEEAAKAIFDKACNGQAATPEEHTQFATYMMVLFGHWDAEKGWTKQLHLGAYRNARTKGFLKLGPDTGFDSIGDFPQLGSLARYLDQLDQEDALPKTIVYNLNPADNYVFATLMGDFQDGRI